MEPSNTPRNLSNFHNILKECNESDFLYMSRKWEPVHTNLCARKTNPLKLKSDTLHSTRVNRVINRISDETSISKEELLKKAQSILDEIAYNRDMSVIRWMGYVLIKILRRSCCGLFVNESSINRIKFLMGNQPVIFTPSHRSYADFILMSFICFYFDVEIPVTAAGMDFQSMWLMGAVLRDCCALFMRRSFGSDKLYWTVFSEYINLLITDDKSVVEFFIEGTRSRSGKSLYPKIGFLSMVLEPYFRAQVPDVAIVPVNISYDRVMEEVLFTYEHLGVPKPKESTSGLLRARSFLNEKFGNIYIDFAEAISVRDYFCHPDSRWMHTLYRDTEELTINERDGIFGLAFHIVRQQQLHSVITAFNVVAAVLSQRLYPQPEPIMASLIVEDVKWLKPIMEHFGALINLNVEDADVVVRGSLSNHKSFLTLTKQDTVLLLDMHTDIMMRRNLSHSSLGCGLYPETMRLSAPFIMLQQYVNPTLHYMIDPAILSIILQLYGTLGLSKDELYQQFCFFRSLLRNEFVFCEMWNAEDFKYALEKMLELNLVEVTGDNLVEGKDKKLQALLNALLVPFLCGYHILCDVILKKTATPTTQNVIVKSAQKEIESLLLRKQPIHPYCLSLDLLSCGLKSLVVVEAVKKIEKSNVVLYEATEKINSVIRELEKVLPFLHTGIHTNSNEGDSSSEDTSTGYGKL